MHLNDVLWAVDTPSHVTLVAHGQEGTTVLVERSSGPFSPDNPLPAKAFVLSDASDEGLTINGCYVDLGESTQDFRNILDEAAIVATLGQTYLSDPEAGR